MTRLEIYQPAASSIGAYCAINANNTAPAPYAPGVVVQPQAQLVSVTFLAIAGTGVTAGGIAPAILGPDGNYHVLATTTTLTAAGYGLYFALNTPVDGVAWIIGSTITGGTVYFQISAVQV
jgi:hypothetical protein